MSFEGKVVIVTGATKGIGRAIAVAFSNEGAQLAICARHHEELEKVSSELKGDVYSEVCDASDETNVENFVKGVKDKYGKIDILVNNVGLAVSAPLMDMTTEFWQRVINTNLSSVFYFCRAVAPVMVGQKRGVIINICSSAGKHGGKYITAYSASKHAVLGFTESLAEELDKAGVRVNAICPGYVNTPATMENVKVIMAKTGKTEKEVLDFMASQNRSGRLIQPEEVAEEALKVASEDSKLSGEAIDI